MKAKIVALLMLAAFPGYAQSTVIPDDAPVVLAIESGELVTNGNTVGVGKGVFLNPPAVLAIQGTIKEAVKELTDKTDKVNELNAKVAELETKQLTPGVVILIVAGSFLFGVGTGAVIVGVATASRN